MPVLQPRDPRDKDKTQFGIQVPKWLNAELQAVADSEGYSRNELVVEFLKWALKQHAAETKKE